MNYALLSYRGTNNLGDEIQSIAARQFLPNIDTFVDRECLSAFAPKDNKPRAVILNGWFMHRPERWPPSPLLWPLLVSFHLSRGVFGAGVKTIDPARVILAEGVREYLREHGPVGARDLVTLQLLQTHGVDAYFSGCLTLTLSPRGNRPRQDYVCAVDVSDEIVEAIQMQYPGPIRTASHRDAETLGVEARFQKAEGLLELYESAFCVVTTRLHCALPSLALGTPVLFLEDQVDKYRFAGLRDLLHTATTERLLSGESDFDFASPPANRPDFLVLRKGLLRICEEFVADCESGRTRADHGLTRESGDIRLVHRLRHEGALGAYAEQAHNALEALAEKRAELERNVAQVTSSRDQLARSLQEITQSRDTLAANLEAVTQSRDELAHFLEGVTQSRAWRFITTYYRFYHAPLIGPFLRFLKRIFRSLRGLGAHLARLKWASTVRVKNVLRRHLPPHVLAALRRRLLRSPQGTLPLVHARAPSRRLDRLVSVIIPCFNYGRFVTDAVDSVLKQTLQDYEIIVVDDGSTDPATIEVLEALQHPKLHVFRQRNKGLPGARNAGIEIARGEYICCLDADDQLDPTFLEKCVSLLESNPGVGIAYTWLKLYGDENGIWETANLDLDRLLVTNHIIVSAVYRRSDWVRAGGYSEEMRGGYEDWEFWLRLAGLGLRGMAIAEPLFLHHRHGRTMTHEANDMSAELMARMQHRNHELFEKPGVRRALRKRYRDVQLDMPFVELSRPEQFLRPTHSSATLFLLPWLDLGGAEMMILDLMKGLVDNRSIFVVTTVPHPNPVSADFAALAEAIFHLPNFLAERDWQAFLSNLVHTRAIQSILVSGSQFGYQALGHLRREQPGLRVIDLLHNDSPLGHIANAIDADAAIDVHVGVAPRVAETLARNGVAPGKCMTILNGVDIGSFALPDASTRKAARARFGLAENAFVCLFVGRFSVEKRADLFCGLAGRFFGEGRVRFVMVGDGPLKSVLSQKHPSVRFIEAQPRSDMPLVYAIADLLVITSEVEGMPMTMLEALACGVPVLATRAGDIRTVIHDGENGYTVPIDSPELLEAHIRNLVSDPQRLSGMKAATRPSLMQQGLTLSTAIGAYGALLTRLETGAGIY